MHIRTSIWLRMMIAISLLGTGCASQSKQTPDTYKPAASRTASDEKSLEFDDASLSSEEEALFDDDTDEWETEDAQGVVMVSDPIEPFNRAMFYFNDKLYTWVLKPVTLGYRSVTPEPVRVSIGNFFTNLSSPIRLVNNLLQGKGQAAAAEFSKLFVNSTAGMFGFFDLFEDIPEMNLEAEDLGQTFGSYGVGNGFYIVWPVLGASTLRDTIGMAGDTFLNPITYIDATETALAVKGFDRVNVLSFRIEDIDAAKKAAFDPYEANRNFYIQLRQSKINR